MLTTALAPLIWGSTYLVTTKYLPPERPLTAVMLRTLLAGLLLLLWTRKRSRRAEITCLMVLGVLNIALFQVMLFISAYRLPGGLAAILNSTQSFVGTCLYGARGHTTATAGMAFGALGVIGIVLLVASPQTHLDSLGIAAALCAALSMTAGIIFTKRWHQHLSVLALTGWQLCIGGLYLLPFALWHEPPLPALGARHIGGYLYLSLCGALLAYVLFFRGARHLSPATVSSPGLLSPLCAFLLGWVFLDQHFGWRAISGFALVLASIYGVQRAMTRWR